MFVQFIEGQVTDRDTLREQYERWLEELAPGAEGWLGTTAGVTDDGVGFMAARFASAQAAQANSRRPEQGEWWGATSACFEGPVDFLDCEEVELMLGGGSDDAGFVQVIRGRMADLDRAREMMQGMEDELPDQRPDVIGGYVGTRPDGTFAQVVYFTSEEAAREGEAGASSDETEGFMDLMADPPRFLDLRDPWLTSASGSG